MDQNNKEKKDYELSLLCKDRQVLSAIEALLKQYDAEIFYQGPITDIRLAYPMKKHQQATFYFLHFRVFPETIEKIVQSLKLNSSILRLLVVTPPLRKEDKIQKPGIITKAPRVTLGEPAFPPVTPKRGVLTNEALEEKLEEILK